MKETANLPALAVMLTASLIAAVNCPAEEPRANDDPASFISLFNGKTLEGWSVMNGGQFVVSDGVLKLHRGWGWLRSERQYEDFVLQVEFRFMRKGQDGGIFLRASADDDMTTRYGWPRKRYEVQCRNDHTMARIYGAMYNTPADHHRDGRLVAKLLRKPGEWNTFRIECTGRQLTVKLNGQTVTTSDALEPREGHIGLQGDGGELEFRNIRIKEIVAR